MSRFRHRDDERLHAQTMSEFMIRARQIILGFPIETYIVLLVGVCTFFVVFTIDQLTDVWDLHIDPFSVLMGPIAGGGYISTLALLLILYGSILFLIYLFAKNPDDTRPTGIKRALADQNFFLVTRSILYWFIVSGSMVFGEAALINVLFRSFSYAQMAAASDHMLFLDQFLFGLHPNFFIHTLQVPETLQRIITASYLYLPAALGIVLLISFCRDERLFRITFLSLIFSLYLSIPFWILFPAIPPYEAYVLNTFHQKFPTALATEIAGVSFSPKVAESLTAIEGMWLDPAGKSFSVSSFPSTHIIWATIMLYGAFVLRKWFGLLLVPFYLLNVIATQFLLEHYAVDVLLGIFIGIISICIAKFVLGRASHHFTDTHSLLSIFPAMDMRPLLSHLSGRRHITTNCKTFYHTHSQK